MPFPTLKIHRLSLPLYSLSFLSPPLTNFIFRRISLTANYRKALPPSSSYGSQHLCLIVTDHLPQLSSAQLNLLSVTSSESPSLPPPKPFISRLNFQNSDLSESEGCAGEALGLGFRFCCFSCEE